MRLATLLLLIMACCVSAQTTQPTESAPTPTADYLADESSLPDFELPSANGESTAPINDLPALTMVVATNTVARTPLKTTTPLLSPRGIALVEYGPADGSSTYARFWAHDYSVIIGNSWQYTDTGYLDRIWLWSPLTGCVFLDEVTPLGVGATCSEVRWTSTHYIILASGYSYTPMKGAQYLISVPKDPALWFEPGDFDHDGDVDQSDFGLLQRQLGLPGCPMTVDEFERCRTGPGIPARSK